MYAPELTSCRSIDQYEKLNRIDEGTYGIVYRARDKKTGEVVALKKLKLNVEREGFPITSLREIQTLLICKHEHIVNVREVVFGSTLDSVYIVMDFIEHDLKALMLEMPSPFLQSEIKTIMLQLISAIKLLHDNWIVHRDLKTSNLLLSNKGMVKVADFGLARKFGEPMDGMTQMVVTLWYRAPELLLGAETYTTAIDMWSIGCIFAELIENKPYFQGQGEMDQLRKYFEKLGTPNERIWPGFNRLPHAHTFQFKKQSDKLRYEFKYLTENGLDLLRGLLTYDPSQRLTADQALDHPYFREAPMPLDPSMFPSWPSKASQQKVVRERSPKS